MNAIARTLGMWTLAGTVLVAAEFWDEKDFTTWSDQEVIAMLTDSPWSRQVTIVLRGPARGQRPDRVSRVDVGGATDGDAGDERGVPEPPELPSLQEPPDPNDIVYERNADEPELWGRGRADRATAASERVVLTVSWRSAPPAKRALVRRQVGVDARIPLEQQQFLAQLEPLYVVSVDGLPRQFARLAQDREALMAGSVLRRGDKGPIVAEDVEVFVGTGETVIIEYAFSRDDAITLGDEEVEFITKLGEIEVKRTFVLDEMVLGGELVM